MKLLLAERFQQDFRGLEQAERLAVIDAVLALPTVLGKAHAHAGIGVRKVHRSGVFEARVGLGLRMLFGLQDDMAKLLLIGTHDEVRRFLRGL